MMDVSALPLLAETSAGWTCPPAEVGCGGADWQGDHCH